jgi:dynamin 1-like protein
VIANGTSSAGVAISGDDDGATDSADEFPPGATPPTTTTGRSVSATLQPERERARGSGAKASPRSSNASDSRVGTTHRNSHGHHHHPNSQQHHAAGAGAGHPSSQTTRETFLNYFFGQNGPGPVGAGNAAAASAPVANTPLAPGSAAAADMVSRREADGGVLRSELLAGKHDGNRAAYDMKSLGKHIEAVRTRPPLFIARNLRSISDVRSRRTGHS